MSYYSLV